MGWNGSVSPFKVYTFPRTAEEGLTHQPMSARTLKLSSHSWALPSVARKDTAMQMSLFAMLGEPFLSGGRAPRGLRGRGPAGGGELERAREAEAGAVEHRGAVGYTPLARPTN